MNLTVAMKIIGGFAVISILLILTSVISLLNLDTISKATQHQNQLAIPILKGSNKLALELGQMESATIKGFYQTTLTLLNDDLTTYKAIHADFLPTLQHLKALTKDENALLSNVEQVANIFDTFEKSADLVFQQRMLSIEQKNILTKKISNLEEKIDNLVMLLLDLSDHPLANSKLQRAISLGEHVEMLCNDIITSLVDYSDALSQPTAEIIESDITYNLNSAQASVKEIVNELNLNNMQDAGDLLHSAYRDIEQLLSTDTGILFHKQTQLTAVDQAKTQLNNIAANTVKASKILHKQVELANQVTLASSELIKEAVSSGNKQTAIIAIISIIIAIVIARFTLVSITRPLSQVNKMLNIVSSGDLSRKLDETGKDEFAQLAKNCNRLIDSLRHLIEGIVNRSVQLAAAAEQTSTVTTKSTIAIEDQRNQVEKAACATTEMSSTAQTVLSSANDALGEIKHADDEAERVKTISNRNRQTIQQLANEVEEAAHVINNLQKDTASIGSILDVIRGIADQTNLLALNAAIEAARAGEQGRGFAVVADEVRTLASRTQASTSEIQSMIESLQSGAGKAVTVMDAGKAKASDCVRQSEEAETALETITQAVHEAFDRSSQIATAAKEQSIVSSEISQNLESIVAIAEQTTAGSQQTAASSSEVARLSEELQQSVQEFKL